MFRCEVDRKTWSSSILFLSATIALFLPIMSVSAQDLTDKNAHKNQDQDITKSKHTETITPYTDIYPNDHKPIDIPASAYNDAYTRILIKSKIKSNLSDGWSPYDNSNSDAKNNPVDTIESGTVKGWDYTGRHWYERIVSSKEFLVSVTLKISANQFKATIPIATFDHKSASGLGEQWERKIYRTVESYPLFLVGLAGEGGTPSIDLEYNGSDTVNSQLAASAVGAVFDVAKELGPQTKVVTSLSQASIERQATVIDSAVSKLLGKSVNEGHQADQDLRFANYGEAMYFNIKLPRTERGFKYSQAGEGPLPVGTWIVSFEEPRPSIFVDWRICGSDKIPRCAKDREMAIKNVYRDVDGATVLATPLSATDNGLGQVSAYISQLDWYKAAIPKLSQSNTGASSGLAPDTNSTATSSPDVKTSNSTATAKKTKKSSVELASSDSSKEDSVDEVNSEFCRKIDNTMTQLGLSTVDAGIVVWAVYKSMPDIPQTARLGLASNATCATWISGIENVKNSNSEINKTESNTKKDETSKAS